MAGVPEKAEPPQFPDVSHPDQETVGEGNASFRVSVIDGTTYPSMTSRAHLGRIREMDVRDDDIWLISYPKTGTHWTWEILNMVLKQSAQICKDANVQSLLELPMPPHVLDVYAKAASPRIVVTHLPPKDMPEKLWASKAKVVYPYRNPKDSLVSQFHHVSKIKEGGKSMFDGTLDDWMQIHLQFPEASVYDGLVNHMHAWMEKGKAMPNRFLAVEFEAMKKDPSEHVQRMADFLGVPLSPELKADIVDQTHIKKLKATKLSDDMKGGMLAKVQTWFYRKGEVGGWKSEFTVAQNEAMDALLNRNPLYKDLSFTYTL